MSIVGTFPLVSYRSMNPRATGLMHAAGRHNPNPFAFAQFASSRMILDRARMVNCLAIYPEGGGGATPFQIERYRMEGTAAKIGAAKRPHQR